MNDKHVSYNTFYLGRTRPFCWQSVPARGAVYRFIHLEFFFFNITLLLFSFKIKTHLRCYTTGLWLKQRRYSMVFRALIFPQRTPFRRADLSSELQSHIPLKLFAPTPSPRLYYASARRECIRILRENGARFRPHLAGVQNLPKKKPPRCTFGLVWWCRTHPRDTFN